MTNLIHETDEQVESLLAQPVREYSRTPVGLPQPRALSEPALWPRYIEALVKRKFFILAGAMAALVLAWLFLFVWPRQYVSESKLMIRVGRESVSLDPSATTSQTLMLQKTQEEEVNSALDLLRSRRIAERTVDRLGAESINNGSLPSTIDSESTFADKWIEPLKNFVKGQLTPLLYATGIKEDLSERELAIMVLTDQITITAERRSAVVSIEAFAKTPEMAQAIAQNVAEEFISEYLEVTHNSGSYAFFSGQAQAANDSRSLLSEQKRQFMQERKLVTISANQGILVDQLGTIEREVIALSADLDQTQAEIEDVLLKLAAMPVEVISEKKGSSDATWSGMRQQVYGLELEEQQLSAKYSDDNPLLLQVREKLTGARGILAKLESERVDESKTPNPLRLRLEEELQKLQTKVVGLRANLQLREEQHAEVEQKISEILDAERDLEQIERDIKMADTRLDLLRQKHEEARVLSEMQKDRISNLSLFQPATLVERPASPNKKLLFLAFAILGFLGSSALVLVQELNGHRIRTAFDVEQELGLPVVANIDHVHSVTGRTGRLLKAIDRRPKMQAEFSAILSDVMFASQNLHKKEHGKLGRAAKHGTMLGVIGVGHGAGSSSIAAALALVAADRSGLESILIDANGERPALSRFFKLNGPPGLEQLANGDATHDECIQKRSKSALGLISSSAAYKKHQRLTAAPKSISAAIERYRETADLIIVDLPSASSVDRAVALTQYLDFVLLVIQSDKTELSDAERVVRRLGKPGRQVVGVVLNKTHHYLPTWLSRLIGLN